MKIKLLHDAQQNKTWAVRLVEQGDLFGRDNRLVNRTGCSLVEFYDPRHPHTELGQFVSRYHAATLAQSDAGKAGLQLDGGVPDWTVSSHSMKELVRWLEQVIPQELSFGAPLAFAA